MDTFILFVVNTFTSSSNLQITRTGINPQKSSTSGQIPILRSLLTARQLLILKIDFL